MNTYRKQAKNIKPFSLGNMIDDRLTLLTVKRLAWAYNCKDDQLNYKYFISEDFKTIYKSWPTLRQKNFLVGIAGPLHWEKFQQELEN